MSSEAVHRALDGIRFKYHGDLDLHHPASSVANVVVDGVLREFTSGPIWAGEKVAEHAKAVLDEEFACQGGRLRIGEAVNKDAAGRVTDRRIIAVWQGQQHNLLTHLYHATAAEAIALVNAVKITEQPDGIVIAPRREAGAHFQEPPVSGKYIPEIGMVEAKRRGKREVRGLPTWPGAKVQSGELFRDTLSDGNTYFVLVTATAVVTVVSSPSASPATVANRAASLDVQVMN